MARTDPRPHYGQRRRLGVAGYIYVWGPGHPLAHADGYVPEHRLVAYEAGLLLDLSLHVHHINGRKDDNRPENLVVVSGDAHALHHAEERGWVENQYGRFAVKEPKLRASRIKRRPKHVCASCGVTFRARADALYCGDACRIRAFKRRQRSGRDPQAATSSADVRSAVSQSSPYWMVAASRPDTSVRRA